MCDPETNYQTTEACIHAAFFMDGFLKKASGFNLPDFGFIEMFSDMTQHVVYLQALLSAVIKYNPDIDYPGVLDYEVSNQFGEWYAWYVLEFSDTPPSNDAEEQLSILLLTFFGQGASNAEYDEIEKVFSDFLKSRRDDRATTSDSTQQVAVKT